MSAPDIVSPSTVNDDGLAPPSSTPGAGDEPIWKLIVLWMIVALILSSPAFGGAVINEHMRAALNMDRTAVGAGFGTFAAAAGLSAPFTALAFRYFGIRNVMLAGTALAVIAAILLITVVSSGPLFIVSYGLMMGLAVGLAGILPVQTVAAQWFRSRRALAVSVVMSSGEVAGVVMPLMFVWLIGATGDWRSAWWVTLGCFLVGGALIVWVIPGRLAVDKHELEMSASPPEGTPQTSRVYKTRTSWATKDAMRTRQFALLLLFATTTCIAWVFLLAHGVGHLRDLGYSDTVAASAVSIIVAASFFGNAAAGLLGDRFPPHLLGCASLLLIAAGLALAMAPSGFDGMLLFAIVFGFGYGAGQVCWITLLTNYFGTKAFPTLLGIFLAASSVASQVGAISGGAVFDHFRTYGPAFLFLIGFTTVVALLQLLASPVSLRR